MERMPTQIIRDADIARQFLLQGLWLQRALPVTQTHLPGALTWYLTLADVGTPLPPLGFVADVGHLALGTPRPVRARGDTVAIPGWTDGLARTYDDLFLGRLHADPLFERACHAVKRIDPARQPQAIAYLVRQLLAQLHGGGVEFSPGIIRGLLQDRPEENLRKGRESLERDRLLPLLQDSYRSLIAGARRAAELLLPADVLALEQGTALLSMGEYIAHRQVLQAVALFEQGLPITRPQPLPGRPDLATRLLDSDAYPVGGFASISTRGTMESLLHSQLALMETDPDQRPDLFDVKFLRDELFYYSRDENQFLRRRCRYAILLAPDLARARFKDAALPYQRIVFVLAVVVVAVRQLTRWLADGALYFDIMFGSDRDGMPLGDERALLELLLRDEIALGHVTLREVPLDRVGPVMREAEDPVRAVAFGSAGTFPAMDDIDVTCWKIDAAPVVDGVPGDGSDPLMRWQQALATLLRRWI